MNNKKTTKRALLSSVMAIVLCLAMLIGTTFAWFTDSASTAVNKIQAGNLDVKLEYLNDNEWTEVSNTTKLFNENALWEPGYTEIAYLRVSNAGSLALKYKFAVNKYAETIGVNVVDGSPIKLSEILKFGIIGSETQQSYTRDTARAAVAANPLTLNTYTNDIRLGVGETKYYTVVVYMPEEIGNEANHATGTTPPSIDLGINLVATQDTVESDSNNNTYDAGAVYPVVNATEFQDALDAIATKGTIVLGDNISLIDTPITIANRKDITIDTSNYTLKSTWTPASGSAAFDVKPNSVLTLKGNGSIEAYAENPDVTWSAGFPGYANNAISNYGTLVIDGATVKVTTDKVGENGELGASYCVDCYAGSKLHVKSGSIVNAQNIAVRIFANSATESVDVTIDGGTIEGSRGIWLQLPGSDPSVAPRVNLVINGGNIKTNRSNSFALYSYSYNNSFVNTNVTINGGNFLGYVAFGGGYRGDIENVTITGGTFAGCTQADAPVANDWCVYRYTNNGSVPIQH